VVDDGLDIVQLKGYGADAELLEPADKRKEMKKTKRLADLYK